MRLGDALGKVGEERRQLDAGARLAIDFGDAFEVFLARLLHDAEPRPETIRQERDSLRHDVGDGPRALAAAKDHEIDRPGRPELRIGGARYGTNAVAHWIAGKLLFQTLVVGKAR